MKGKKRSVRSFFFGIGVLLIAASVLLLVGWQVSANRNAKRMQEHLAALYALIGEPRAAVPEERTNNDMPALNVGSENFAGILEFPVYNAAFPVGADWGESEKYPCRYDGSIYDGSLIIGTTNQKGQLDFAKEISVGSTVFLTDMTGNRFSYRISDIRYGKHADNDTLSECEGDLTVFVKNIYAFEYVILYCTASGA